MTIQSDFFEQNIDMLRVFANSMICGIILVEVKSDVFTIKVTNKSIERYLGYTKDELIGKNLYEYFTHDEYHNLIQHHCQVAISSRAPLHFAQEFKLSGGVLLLEILLTPFFREDECTYLLFSIYDLTAYTELQRSREETENMYHLIARNASDILTMMTPDGIVTYMSPAVEKLLGYTSEDMIGKSCFDFFHPDDLVPLKNALLQQMESSTLSYRIRKKTGEYISVESKAKLIKNSKTMEPEKIMAITHIIDKTIHNPQSQDQQSKEINLLNDFLVKQEMKIVELKQKIGELQARINILQDKKQST
jgi:PAS domain S-box-containing protein